MTEQESFTSTELTDLVNDALDQDWRGGRARYQPLIDRLAEALEVDQKTINVSHVTGGSKNFNNRFNQSGFRFATGLGVGLLDDNAHVEATFENGVLTLSLPKSEAAKPKQIHVKVGKN